MRQRTPFFTGCILHLASAQVVASAVFQSAIWTDIVGMYYYCAACLATLKHCYYPFYCTFDCTQATTAGWGNVTPGGAGTAQCLAPAEAPVVNQWQFSSRDGTDRTYVIWKKGGGICVTAATCSAPPSAPAKPTFVPPGCPEPDCGDWPGRFLLTVAVSQSPPDVCLALDGDWIFVCVGFDESGHPLYVLESGPSGEDVEIDGYTYYFDGVYYASISATVYNPADPPHSAGYKMASWLFAIGNEGPEEGSASGTSQSLYCDSATATGEVTYI